MNIQELLGLTKQKFCIDLITKLLMPSKTKNNAKWYLSTKNDFSYVNVTYEKPNTKPSLFNYTKTNQ